MSTTLVEQLATPMAPIVPAKTNRPTLPDHISPTAAKAYLGCSLRFYFERILCLPSRTSVSLHVGKAVHAALQAFHLARWRGQDDSVEAVSAAFEESFAALEKEMDRSTTRTPKPATRPVRTVCGSSPHTLTARRPSMIGRRPWRYSSPRGSRACPSPSPG